MSEIVQEIHCVLAGMRRNAKWRRVINQSMHLFGLSAPTSSTAAAAPTADQESREYTVIASMCRLRSLLDSQPLFSHDESLSQSGGVEAALSGMAVLEPFLLIVSSPLTAGPITCLALSSIARLLRLGVFSIVKCPDAQACITAVVQAVTHCKFEATDAASDELVLLRILDILTICVVDAGFRVHLSDESVCQVLECAFSMCFQMRLGLCLRKAAENCVVAVIVSVVECVSGDLAVDSAVSPSPVVQTPAAADPVIHSDVVPHTSLSSNRDEDFVHVSPAPNSSSLQVDSLSSVPFGAPVIRELLRFIGTILNVSDQHNTDSMRGIALSVLQVLFECGSDLIARVPSLLKALPQLADNLLRLIKFCKANGNVVLFGQCVHVCSIFFTGFLDSLANYFEFYMGEVVLAGLWSGGVFYIYQPNKDFLPMEYSKFISYASGILPPFDSSSLSIEDFFRGVCRPAVSSQNISVSSSAFDEFQQILWESLYQLLRNPLFIENLFIKFDCDLIGQDLVNQLVLLLCHSIINKNLNADVLVSYNKKENAGYFDEGSEMEREFGMSVSASFDLLRVLFLAMQRRLAKHGGLELNVGDGDSRPTSNVTALSTRRRLKTILNTAGRMFSESPQECLEYLKRMDMLKDIDSASEVAKCLFTIPTLDKKKFGEYLGKPKSIDILKEFFQEFKWVAGTRIDDALRSALTKFRLPGESQQIERVVSAFSLAYFKKCVETMPSSTSEDPKEADIKSPDAAFILSYAVVMLNTDQHNRQVQRRMKLEDFSRNLRGVNDGVNFKMSYLEAIFNAIRENEIILPDEQKDVFHVRPLNAESNDASGSVTYESGDYLKIDRELFMEYHGILNNCLLYFFSICPSAGASVMLEKCSALYYQACNLAFCYGLSNSLDKMLVDLFRINNLSVLKLAVISDVTTLLDAKTRAINQLTFRILGEFGSMVRQPIIWNQVVALVYRLFENNLINFQCHDFFYHREMAFPKISQRRRRLDALSDSSLQNQTVSESGGFLSALSSFLLASSYQPIQDNEDSRRAAENSVTIDEEMVYEPEMTDDVRQFIDGLSIQELFSVKLRYLDFDSLVSALVDDSFDFEDSDESATESHILRNNVILFRVLFATMVIKNSNNYNKLDGLLSFVRKIALIPSKLHFVVEKYSVYILLDLIMHRVKSGENLGACDKLVSCLENVIDGFLTADFPVSYKKHGLANITFTNAIALYIYTGIYNLISAISDGKSLSSTTEPILKSLAELVKNLLLKTSGFATNSKLLQKAFSLFQLVSSRLDFLERVQVQLHFIQLYSFTFNSSAADTTTTASRIAQKLSRDETSSRSTTPKPLSVTPVTEQFLAEFQEISLKCCTLMYEQLDRLNADGDDAWHEYWLPVLNGFAETVCHPCKETRLVALNLLQKGCSTPRLPKRDYEKVFIEVLYPLMDSLETASSGKDASFRMEEVKLRCCSLLGKLYLHYYHEMEAEVMMRVWLQLLDTLQRQHSQASKMVASSTPTSANSISRKSNHNMTDSVSLLELIPENIKNMILVMSTSEVFKQQSDFGKSCEELTWTIVNPWLPNIRRDLGLDSESPPPRSSSPPKDSSPPASSLKQPVTSQQSSEIGQ